MVLHLLRYSILLCLPAAVFGGSLEQWVLDVTAASSSYFDNWGGEWSEDEVIGEPDRYPDYDLYGDKVWTTLKHTCTGEYIEVNFHTPVYITGVHIYETYMGGGLVTIEALTTASQWHTLFARDPNEARVEYSRIYQPPINHLSEKSRTLKLNVECCVGNQCDWYYVDAIKLVGETVMYGPTTDPHTSTDVPPTTAKTTANDLHTTPIQTSTAEPTTTAMTTIVDTTTTVPPTAKETSTLTGTTAPTTTLAETSLSRSTLPTTSSETTTILSTHQDTTTAPHTAQETSLAESTSSTADMIETSPPESTIPTTTTAPESTPPETSLQETSLLTTNTAETSLHQSTILPTTTPSATAISSKMLHTSSTTYIIQKTADMESSPSMANLGYSTILLITAPKTVPRHSTQKSNPLEEATTSTSTPETTVGEINCAVTETAASTTNVSALTEQPTASHPTTSMLNFSHAVMIFPPVSIIRTNGIVSTTNYATTAPNDQPSLRLPLVPKISQTFQAPRPQHEYKEVKEAAQAQSIGYSFLTFIVAEVIMILTVDVMHFKQMTTARHKKKKRVKPKQNVKIHI